MAFDIQNWNQVSSGKNTKSFSTWSYLTEDTLADVLLPTYFRPISIALRLNDIIEVSTSKSSEPATYEVLRVTSTSPALVTTDKIEEQEIGYYTLNQYIGPEFFVGVGVPGTTRRVTVPLNSFPQSQILKPLAFQYSFIGMVAGSMDLPIGIQNISYTTIAVSDPGNAKNVVLTPTFLTANPNNFIFIDRDGPDQSGVVAFYATWIFQVQ